MADSPWGFIIIGFVMLVLAKPVTKLHIWMTNKWGAGRRPAWFQEWLDSGKYERIFFWTWISLALLILIIHGLRLI